MNRDVDSRPRRSSSRDAFLKSTAELLRRRGYAATGLNEIVARSGAPKGSLYFHFPGGKEQLAAAAMTRSGELLGGAMAAVLASHDDVGAALASLVDALAAGLEASGYCDGCPIATVALETAGDSQELTAVAELAFDSWLEVLRARLEASGLSSAAAERRALLVLSAIEGALLLARVRRNLSPLLAVREELLALQRCSS
jgi:TetR/AcrR family transcriptional regulator, lmrAB and yxaGH operons repressor